MALQVPQHFRDPLLKLRRTRKDLRSCQWPKRQRLWVVRSVRRSDCQQLLRFRIESQLEVALVEIGFTEIRGPLELCSDFPRILDRILMKKSDIVHSPVIPTYPAPSLAWLLRSNHR